MCQLFGRTHKFSASINGICSNQGIFIALTTVQKVVFIVVVLLYILSFRSDIMTYFAFTHNALILCLFGCGSLVKNTIVVLFFLKVFCYKTNRTMLILLKSGKRLPNYLTNGFLYKILWNSNVITNELLGKRKFAVKTLFKVN